MVDRKGVLEMIRKSTIKLVSVNKVNDGKELLHIEIKLDIGNESRISFAIVDGKLEDFSGLQMLEIEKLAVVAFYEALIEQGENGVYEGICV